MPNNKKAKAPARQPSTATAPRSRPETMLLPPTQVPSSSRTRSRTLSGSTPENSPRVFSDASPRANKSSGSSLSRPDYRYSIGPAPVRFPRSGEQHHDAAASPRAGPSRSTSPASMSNLRTPTRSSRPTSNAVTFATTDPFNHQQQQQQRRQKQPEQPSGSASSNLSRPASSKALQQQQAMSLPASTKPPSRSRTPSPSPSSSNPRHKYSAGAESASSSLTQTPTTIPSGPPRRPSSRLLTLTTFPFPHPTTPKGGAEEETKLLGFVPLPYGVKHGLQWLASRWGDGSAGGDGGGEASDLEDQYHHHHQQNSNGERRPLLSQRHDGGDDINNPSNEQNTYRAFRAAGVADAQPRSQSTTTTTTTKYGSMRTTYSSTTIDSDEVDTTDPYGYRRLAGPELLPTYHEEHVLPRRRARHKKKAWRKRCAAFLCPVPRRQGQEEEDALSESRERQRRALVLGAIASGLLLAALLGLSWYWFFWLGEHRGDD